MKIVRFISKDSAEPVYGKFTEGGKAELIEGNIFGEYTLTGKTVEIEKLLAPVVPSMICAIGLNFAEHAAEFNLPVPDYPVLFMKVPSAIQNPGDPIEIPTHLASHQVDYEAELVVIIGKDCKNATPENALDFVLG